MTGYQWQPTPPQPDPRTLIALLRKDNQRLTRELSYWKNAAQQRQKGERS